MQFKETKFKDAWLIEPKVFKDNRGFFFESYSEEKFRKQGIKAKFVQDNHSMSMDRGVLRGLHFQKPLYAQAKLVRVIKGAVYDVIIDLRNDSKTYGKWEGFELTAENFLMLFLPRGFAHGFCTLQKNTEVLYKVDNPYNQTSESGIIWNDEVLQIDWPIKNPVLSEKDKLLSGFRNLQAIF